jgi:hypothetical protein
VSKILPRFNEDGFLPEGDYRMTLLELKESELVNNLTSGWDREWRLQLVNNLEVVVEQLWQVNITDIYVNGSFVEDKDHPNDIDVYFNCDRKYLVSGQLEEDLNKLDPHKCWTWEDSKRKLFSATDKKHLPIWWQYRIDPWPNFGQGAGIINQKTNKEMTFPELFRTSRFNFIPKGIIKIQKS